MNNYAFEKLFQPVPALEQIAEKCSRLFQFVPVLEHLIMCTRQAYCRFCSSVPVTTYKVYKSGGKRAYTYTYTNRTPNPGNI